MTIADEWWRKPPGGFTQIPNEVLRSTMGLQPSERITLYVLMSWIWHQTPSGMLHKRGGLRQRDLAAWAGLSRKGLQIALTGLEKEGFIEVERSPGGYSIYAINLERVKAAIDRYG